MKNDYRVGKCDSCETNCEDLRWGEQYPERYCTECYKKKCLCDKCLKPSKKLKDRKSQWNERVINRYCESCSSILDEDDAARAAGMWVSRSGPHESYMRRWWGDTRRQEVLDRMTPAVIERVEEDIARVILSGSQSEG